MEFVKRKVNLDEDILVVDKPVDWTSHDVVAKVRGELGRKTKVGHGGTLDPFATGVLLILIGKATRRFDEIRTWEKEYVMEVKLGEATDTGDPTGKVIEKKKVVHVDEQKLKSIWRHFIPGYEQTVPTYSAAKIHGQRSYKLARAGKEFIQPKKWVKISEIELISLKGSSLKVRVVCGSGTYMRQLAMDIGQKLSLPAYCAVLRRTRVGNYLISSLTDGLIEEQR
jgi:tRNA pseudouridine55 synthase